MFSHLIVIWQHKDQKSFKIVSLGYDDAILLEDGLAVLLRRLLAMIAELIVKGRSPFAMLTAN